MSTITSKKIIYQAYYHFNYDKYTNLFNLNLYMNVIVHVTEEKNN